MEKQKIFRSSYVAQLKDNLKKGLSLHLYKNKEFEYDKEKVLILPNVYRPTDLLKKMDVKNDFKSAVALYEAYKNLTPLQASDDRFWTYLTHVDLFPYMQNKWIEHIAKQPDKEIERFLKHWFLNTTSQDNLMRHTLAGLWWGVHLTIDRERSNKYELTEVFFRNKTLRARTMGPSLFFRHKEAVIGVLEFFKENNFRKFDRDHRIFTEYINLIGGTKPLSYFDRHFFKKILYERFEKLKQKI